MIRLTLSTCVALALLLAPRATAQVAAITYYGSGCADAAGNFTAPRIRVDGGLPRLGTTLSIRYFGANRSGAFPYIAVPVLVTSVMRDNAPIPPLTPAMGTNCTLLVVPLFVMFLPPAGAGAYVDHLDYTIPNDVGLIGFTVDHQYLTYHEACLGSCRFDFVMVSYGAEITIGI